MNTLVNRTLPFLLALVLVIAGVAPAAAQSPAAPGRAPSADAMVKVAHFASFADSLEGTSVTVRVDGADALTEFQFGQITDALAFVPGDYLIEILPTGTNTVAISGTVSLSADTQYVLAAIGNGSEQPLELFALVDEMEAPMDGAKLRVAHLAPFAADLMDTEVDICTDGGAVVLDNVPYKGFTDPYLALPAGDYNLQIAAPDDTCSTTFLDLPSIRLADGDITDVFAIGDIANQPLQIASATGLTPSPAAMVKVAHFAPFAASLEGTSVTVRIDGADALTDFQFGEITDYIPLAADDHFIEILPTGTNTVAISGTVEVMAEQYYTLSAIGNGSEQPLELFAQMDVAMMMALKAEAADARLRITHLAPFAADLMDTEVDICTDGGAVVVDNVPYKGFTDPYLSLAPGSYDLLIAAPDDTCSTVFLDIPALYLASGEIYDAFAIGDNSNQPLQVTSGTGLLPSAPAQVKVAHFASFADSLAGTSVTVRVNGADALTGFEFGDITSYLSFDPGIYLLEVLPTGTNTVAISATVELMPAMDYTVAAIGNGSNQPLELLPMVDDNEPPATGAKLRVAHFAPFAADLLDTQVDICTQEGAPIPGLLGIPYRTVTDPYVNLPAGTYDLKVTAAGSSCANVLIDIPPVTLVKGSVGSVYAVGDGINFDPQIISDFVINTGQIFLPFVTR